MREPALMAAMAGQYGAVDDPGYSCAENPVELRFTDQPAHAVFSWTTARQIFDDRMATEAVYDVRGEAAGGLVLRLEGENRLTADGAPVVWVLRPDGDFQGFCWGRMDWSLVQCIDRFVRCGQTPTS